MAAWRSPSCLPLVATLRRLILVVCFLCPLDPQALLQARIVDESRQRLGQWHEQRGQASEREREEALLRALESAIMLETAV